MQTHFTAEQLADPHIKTCDQVLRACVHCGFCTATCPTFVLLGDERDSPRGRIYLIKDMLEKNRPATEADVRHVDRCLSCLACMTTCPSGVHYMHLVDHARDHIEATYKRPFTDRLLRIMLAKILPYPDRFRTALAMARFTRPLARLFLPNPARPHAEAAGNSRVDNENRSLKGLAAPAVVNSARTVAPIPSIFTRLSAMLSLAPAEMPKKATPKRGAYPAIGKRRKRVALLTGCAQSVLAPSINEATIRLLNRAGVEVVLPEGEGCCGALVHHMGREDDALAAARANIDAWWTVKEDGGLDAIAITASGCGTTVKDYGFMLRTDPIYAAKAKALSAITKDITEVLGDLDLGAPVRTPEAPIAYHSACSMQHGQKITRLPKALLTAAGFTVKDVPEGHLCCGSAGTYNIMQPEIAARLRERKLANIETTGATLVATGNIGCMTQLGSETRPVVHTIELLDWAHGGPAPEAAAGVLSEAPKAVLA
ncbi:4Fe-4S dicluster domain-containing protein [Acuticoccus sp. M5D2P5]|uniref:heterodisulfide reductase-related iron-sulfur binding cluster n=1 Tax=Acuticoccus kalidii TaxID=2910977 RepID=UPI001F29694E|nr:heterodisulfide reductase-related iron-sulfur binding cluster [Acuticoccus kalidii]MCF3934272.1 4Fe-4S dicluster domain-containing protein [Acuticoccus kalidii]